MICELYIYSRSIQFLSLKSSPQRIADSRSAFSNGAITQGVVHETWILAYKVAHDFPGDRHTDQIGAIPVLLLVFSRSRARVRLRDAARGRPAGTACHLAGRDARARELGLPP